MLFKIFTIRKMMRDAKENPGQFAGGEIQDLLVGMFIVPILIGILLLALFFILGFTSVLGGPFMIGRIFFYLFLIGGGTTSFILWKIIKFTKQITKKAVDDTIHVENVSKE
jgi:hypothetical protein